MNETEDRSAVGSTDSSHSDGQLTTSDSSKSDRTSNGSKQTTSSGEDASTGSIKKELARKETEYIFRLRVMVILLLIMVAAGVSLLVFFITRNAEQEEFNTQFEGASQQILEAFESIRTERISALSSVAVASIAHGVDHTRTWPFVALSSFQQRSLTARSNSGILQVSINTWVSDDIRDEWEQYAVEELDNRWIQEAYEYQEETGVSKFILDYGDSFNVGVESQSIAYFDSEDYTRHYSPRNSGPYLPFWETSPLLSNEHINIDIFQDETHREHAQTCLDTGTVILGDMLRGPPGTFREAEHNSPTERYSQLLSIAAGEEMNYQGDPMTYVYIPIFDSFRNDRVPKAVMIGLFNWARFFEHILPPHVVGVDVVLNNHCGELFTYQINGDHVVPVGAGDLHEKDFDSDEVMSGILEQGTIADGTKNALSFHVNDYIDAIDSSRPHGDMDTHEDDFLDDQCYHTISVYPSQVFQSSYKSSTPVIITFAVAIIFAFAVAMFIVYDRLVERRQKLVLQKAVQSTAIVSSLFPKNVRDRLMQSSLDKDATGDVSAFQNTPKLKSLVIGGDPSESAESDQPIADLFSNCTVMFADISGFTAWSSTREPAQVFTLLQSVYQAFDKIASRRRVFKVETIGDSYVAVTGLPEPQEMHAVIMAKFASECRVKLDKVTRSLEVLLGPDTGDLSMRFGMHSGPVTAGVLRGDRARFQLFGGTVNTAARMESTGVRGKIQITPSTAECLRQAGKGMWLKPRKDAVHAKGLGTINTFWLDVDNKLATSESSDEVNEEASRSNSVVDSGVRIKNDRLVDWMTEMLSDYIKKVVAKRKSLGAEVRQTTNATVLRYRAPEGQTNFDEVVEELTLPKFDGKGLYDTNIKLPQEALVQLREYVVAISEGYNSNPFHNFDHACHVTMSVHKLLNRVTTPDISEEDLTKGKVDSNHLAARLHDYTHGINSDPMTALAVMFSALVHDVDHRGVSNVQMSKEEPDMAEFYKQKSVAEQNSLDIAWDLLMTKKFDDLRLCMFASRQELMRFRKTFVTLVLATDIFDRELNDLRRGRWEKAFHTESNKIETNLRATIVLEHIIQASDVSHTMQHWHVYLKWNRRLFNEMSAAYRAGRMGADPATFWYEGELKFFDNYIIPLAKKLQECQVFGVSSDEYLNYAQSNRMEWESKGMGVLEEMIEEMKADGMLEEVEGEGML